MRLSCSLNLIALNIACVYAQGEDTSPPIINSRNPEADLVIEEASFVFSANVTDASGIRNVKFILKNASGQTQQYQGNLRDGTTDIYETEPVSLATSGAWQYRIKAVDDSPFRNAITTRPWTDFFVANDPASSIAAAKQEIEALIATTLDVNLAPKFVRLGFHDCVPDALFQGGCDGCVDLSNPDNAGLDIPVNALKTIVEKYTSPAYGLSRADIWALAALVGSEVSQNDISFPMEYIGRIDCENAHEICYKDNGNEQPCRDNRGPHRPLPESDMTTSQLLHWFSQHFDFSARETVAIMGAHTLGGAHRENSGFDGAAGWVNNPARLSNGYYNMICAPPGREGAISDFESAMFAPAWDLEFIDNSETSFGTPDRYQWFHQKDANRDDAEDINLEKLLMLNADIALVRDLEGHLQPNGNVPTCQFRCLNNACRDNTLPRCPHAVQTFDTVVEYEADNLLWLNDFSAAFRKMLIRGYSPVENCTEIPCSLIAKGNERRMLQKKQLNLRH